jgi:translation initiation factor IF-3
MLPQAPVGDGPRVNEDIQSPKIRLIDENGEMIGVVSVREGLERAVAAGLDLVEVSPTAEPPVCKILDYGKYKYELQKKKNEAKKKQKVIEIKEIKMRPVIGENDYQIKLKHMRRFLEDENKVKVSMRFRGREMAHQDIGMRIFERVQTDIADLAKPEFGPKREGSQIVMMLSPLKN